MKKIFLTAGICVATLLGAHAQIAMPKSASAEEQKINQELSRVISACNLTPAQAAKAKPIVTEAIQSREANEKQYSSDKNKLKTANETSMKTEISKLGGIMNADQKAKLTAYEQQQVAKMQAKAGSVK